MNIPPPPKPSAYSACNDTLMEAAKTVATDVMENVGKELHHDNNSDDDVLQCSIYCDGTWKRRGYSSLNGQVTTISMETGKCLDVEILCKVCHTCQRIDREIDDEKRHCVKLTI
jgi:hypothetical protein